MVTLRVTQMKTDTQVRAVKLGPKQTEKRITVQGHKGLVLQVRPSGKRWLFRWKAAGKMNHIALGSYPETSLEQARKKAFDCRARIESGLHPAPLTEKREAVITVRDLFIDWRETQLKNRKDGGKAVQRLFENYLFGQLGDRPAREVRRKDIAAVLDAARSCGVQRSVALLLSLVRQMYRFGISRELLEIDPSAMLRAADFGVRSGERDRVLTEEEIKKLASLLILSTDGKKLSGEARLKDETKVAIWLLLATGARIGELTGCHWLDVDFKMKILNIRMPDTTTKKHEQALHLSDFAMKRFRELSAMTRKKGKDPGWCWPDMRKNQTGPLCPKTITKQVGDRQRTEESRLKGRSKNTGSLALVGGKWVPHDLRRTAATLMGDMGVDPSVIEKILNHSVGNKVQRTYQRQKLVEQQKEALDLLGKKLEKLKCDGELSI